MTVSEKVGGGRQNALLDIRDLSVRFNGQTQNAVNDLSCVVRSGTTLGIVGESGSGKSTACLSLLGLVPSTAKVTGSAMFEGEDLLAKSSKDLQHIRGRQIGLIYQDPMAALNPVRSIGSQLCEPLRIHLGLRRRDARETACTLLEKVGISNPVEKLKSYPFQFSGGMRQRVVIAMAISCNPSLLIADEPTTALDVTVQAQVLGLLRDLQRELQISMIFVSHDIAVVASVADDVAVMKKGQLVEYGSAYSVLHSPAHSYTRKLLDSVKALERGEKAEA